MTIFTDNVITQINEFIRSEVLELHDWDIRKTEGFNNLVTNLDRSSLEYTLIDELEQLDEDDVVERAAEFLEECIVSAYLTMDLEIIFKLNTDSNELQLDAQLVNTTIGGEEYIIIGGEAIHLEVYAERVAFYDLEVYAERVAFYHLDNDDVNLDKVIEEILQSYERGENVDFSHTHKTHVIKL